MAATQARSSLCGVMYLAYLDLSFLEKKARACQPSPHFCCRTPPRCWLLASTARDSSGSDWGGRGQGGHLIQSYLDLLEGLLHVWPPVKLPVLGPATLCGISQRLEDAGSPLMNLL